MELNRTPKYDTSDNETGCCPRFNPDGWDYQVLHFKDKLFLKVKTLSLFHIPINMGRVFSKTIKTIEEAHAVKMDEFITLSYDPSPWRGEHYFAVDKEVPGQEMVRLSGEFLTRVFEGPYKKAPEWLNTMEGFVIGRGKELKKIYFFYTTCPGCARHYGKNYVVALAEVK